VYAETERSTYDGSQRVMCFIFFVWNLFLGISNYVFFVNWIALLNGRVTVGDELKRMWKQSAYYPSIYMGKQD
jgi:hypothetical protein